MTTERIRWQEWDAVRCTAGNAELVVGLSAGPRLLSLRRAGGRNLLHLDASDFHVGDWRLYGGHRFTVAPEGPQSYAPDNAPCDLRHRVSAVSVAAPPDANGLQRTLVIEAANDQTGFDLLHLLENHGLRPWTGALWAITCVPRAGTTVVAPRLTGTPRFWPGTDPTPWTFAPDTVVITADGTRGKAGWYAAPAWLAALQPDAAFVIHAPEPPPPDECVDGGCNLEVFTGADYVELETLGGRITLGPAERARHLQRWRLLPPDYAPRDWAALGRDAGCAPTKPEHLLSHAR